MYSNLFKNAQCTYSGPLTSQEALILILKYIKGCSSKHLMEVSSGKFGLMNMSK